MIDEIHFLEEKYNSKLEQKNKVNIKTYLEYIYLQNIIFIQIHSMFWKYDKKIKSIQTSNFYENLKTFKIL